MITNQDESHAIPRSNRRAWAVLSTWAGGVVFALVVLLVWPYGMSAYDESHRRQMECDVSAAEEYAGSTVSRTGLGAPFSYVKVDTKNCGVLILQGVKKKAQQSVAERLSKSCKVTFEVGESSYWFRGALRVINRYPTAFAYHRES